MRFLIIALFIATAGCAGKVPAPEVSYYLLRSDAAALEGPSDIGLGTVDVATYIDRPGLVLEVEPGVMRPAVYHHWAEPLRESLRGYLADELSRRVQAPVRHQGYGSNAWKDSMATIVNVHINELHGTSSGDARISASWIVAMEDSSLEHRFEKQVRLSASGYDALVGAEKALLNALTDAISRSL